MDQEKIIYKDLSYKITGILFQIHNEIGRYGREKQYADALESLLAEAKLCYDREKELSFLSIKNKGTNRADFVVEGKIIIELKAKSSLTKDDYFQVKRYLEAGNYELGLLINFRDKYVKPKRILRPHS